MYVLIIICILIIIVWLHSLMINSISRTKTIYYLLLYPPLIICMVTEKNVIY